MVGKWQDEDKLSNNSKSGVRSGVFTCAGADSHHCIKAHLLLHISPQVIEETLLVRWSLKHIVSIITLHVFLLKKISLIWSRMVLLTRWYSSLIPGNMCICRWSRPLKWGPPLMLLHQHTGWEIGRGPHSNPV